MLGWIFKKMGPAPARTPAPAVAAKSPPQLAVPTTPAVDWAAQLAQAHGNDDALLSLVRAALAPLQVKQAAVEAMDGEAALNLAEREFRSHDRRVHKVAKRQLQAKVTLRQTREQAAILIETACGLAGEADVAVNRLVKLDQAWLALDLDLIEVAQRDQFAAMTAQLSAQVQQRSEVELQRKRWQVDAAQALRRLQTACTEAAAGTQDRAGLADAMGAARGALAAQPPDHGAVTAATAATEAAQAALQRALELATALDDHLAVLDRLLAEPAAAAPTATDDPQQEWQALVPLPDAPLAALLQARHARWQQARDQARHARHAQRREQSRELQHAKRGEQITALADSVAQVETALDAGQLTDAHRHLSDIVDAVQVADAPDALRVRVAAAQARLAQLHGWQHWAGARARDELVLQAEALAAATVAGRQGKADGEVESDADAEVARLSTRQRAEVIATLRARWKEIDHSGGAGARALWQRFDAALEAAYAPVATQVAAQRAAREANLSARHQLLEVLEAVRVGATAAPADSAAPASTVDDEAPQEKSDVPADAHALATALERFQAEWRKLGPLEHTVPRAARAALGERMEAALRRVAAPLQAARRLARADREALVARARALAGDAPGRGRDLVDEVRALQAEWQRQARALPLARAEEQALWTDFKTAIDAAFAARAAVSSARDAELEAHAAERAALIARLQVRPELSPSAQRRALAEVDAAWQRCGPAPRGRADALDAEFRAARDALRQWLDQSAHRAWQSTCDALDAKLALCLAREQEAAADVEPEAQAASWQALPVLPAPLEEALRRRAGLAPADGADTAPPIDDLLLQIEAAWDLPTPPAFEAMRRERKLLALKAALGSRHVGASEALPPDAALAQLLGRGGADTGQRERLAAVLAAWRRRGPQRPA